MGSVQFLGEYAKIAFSPKQIQYFFNPSFTVLLNGLTCHNHWQENLELMNIAHLRTANLRIIIIHLNVHLISPMRCK